MKLIKIYNTTKRQNLRAVIKLDDRLHTIEVGTILALGNGITYYFNGIDSDYKSITFKKFFGQWNNIKNAKNEVLILDYSD